MPSASESANSSAAAGGGDDALASSDEIKVFKDEGEDEERSSENLTDLKSSLITEGEGDKAGSSGSYSGPGGAAPSVDLSAPSDGSGKPRLCAPRAEHPLFGLDTFGYPGGWSLGGGMAGKMGVMSSSPGGGSPLSPYLMYGGHPDSFSQPPPAHMGISAGVHLDGKSGIRGPAVYPALTSQYAPPMYNHAAFAQLQWHPMYSPMGASSFRSYGLGAGLGRLPPTLLPPHPGHPMHPSLHNPFSPTPPGIGQKHSDLSALNESTSSPLEQTALSPHESDGGQMVAMYASSQLEAHCAGQPSLPITPVSPPRRSSISSQSTLNSTSHHNQNSSDSSSNGTSEKKSQKPATHVKKPLNAFMLYMKEMRAKVVAECTLKESAAINQILGRRWHSLTREEQSKYYEMARKERQLHMQMYPGWTARDNYALNTKKKKKKKERIHDADVSNSAKKCRARYGLDQQNNWCKPCRRKKKCIRYRESDENPGSNNPGSNAPSSNGPASNQPYHTEDSDSDSDDEDEPTNISSVEAPTPPDSVLLHQSPGAQSLGTDDEHPLPSPQLMLPLSPRIPMPLPISYKNHPLSIHQLTSQSDCKREPQDHPMLGVESILTPPSTETPHLLTVT